MPNTVSLSTCAKISITVLGCCSGCCPKTTDNLRVGIASRATGLSSEMIAGRLDTIREKRSESTSSRKANLVVPVDNKEEKSEGKPIGANFNVELVSFESHSGA